MSFRMWIGPTVACSALFVVSQLAQAQSKVGVVNMQRAVLESAEIKAASAAMEAKYKPRVAELDQLNKEIAALGQNLQSNAGKLTPAAEADMTAQYQRKQRDAQRKNDDLNADVERERNEILQRSSAKMSAVVKKVAESKGLDLVIDAPYAVYFKEALDITSDAIAAYDKENPSGAAGSPSKPK